MKCDDYICASFQADEVQHTPVPNSMACDDIFPSDNFQAGDKIPDCLLCSAACRLRAPPSGGIVLPLRYRRKIRLLHGLLYAFVVSIFFMLLAPYFDAQWLQRSAKAKIK